MKPRILIIEDNATNLELMLYLFEEQGYAPLTAEVGEEGLTIVKQERPDLVLCDIQLPGMDGYEVARHIKADPGLREIPVIAVSALAMVGDREKGLAAGFDGYISKPITAQTFVQQVEAYLKLPPDATATPARAAAAEVASPPNKSTILVVDDLAANTKLLESLLEPFGYRVLSANGMTEAMAQARQQMPDLIVSDVRMHEGSGYELCEALKTDHRLKHIPIILLTSTYQDEGSRQKGLALGASRFLFRPLDARTLLAEIEGCLAAGN